ncbi:MAG: NAD(+)/NADH kinase [Gemmatimonadetes bacterium]|nr:NAD(+)/NADH kinase [Gemmatimonadota bacterium]
MNVGVVGNPRYQDLRALLARLVAVAPRHGFTLCGEPKLADLWPSPIPSLDGQTLDLLLTFGGDGTLLRGARLIASQSVPVLGVNIGHVGFLATASPDNLEEAIAAVARRDYELEDRRTLECTIEGADGERRPTGVALNDVVIHKSGVARVVHLRVMIDAEEVGQYSADGIIVATQTGSTAYSLSAGGPIIVPGLDAIVITAICPHTLAVRPIVAPSSATVVVEIVPPWTDDVLVSYDGQVGTTLQRKDRVLVHPAPTRVRLIRLGKEGFFARLRRKLHWGDLSDRQRT